MFRAAELVKDLQAYVDGDDPIFPRDDPRIWALHEFLYAQRPAPEGLRPLLGPRAEASEVDGRLLKRDLVALAVVTSFMRRIAEDPGETRRAALWDAIAYAGAWFSFDPVYGASPTATGTEVVDFYMNDRIRPSRESRASLERNFQDSLERWRGRVNEMASTTFFGIVLRHIGPEGLDRLFGEWAGMSENERHSLLRLAAEEEQIGRPGRERMVEALLDPSLEVREAAYDALRRIGAPLGDLEFTDREEDLRRGLEPLRRWAAETDS